MRNLLRRLFALEFDTPLIRMQFALMRMVRTHVSVLMGSEVMVIIVKILTNVLMKIMIVIHFLELVLIILVRFMPMFSWVQA